MAANISPIYPASVALATASLTAATPITSRADITGVAGLVQLIATSSNGIRFDALRIQCKGTSVASIIFLWLYDGTTAKVIDEIQISAITVSNTTPAFNSVKYYDTIAPGATQQLYVSQTVATDCTVIGTEGVY